MHLFKKSKKRKTESFKQFLYNIVNYEVIPCEIIDLINIDAEFFSKTRDLRIHVLHDYLKVNNMGCYKDYSVPLLFYLSRNGKLIKCNNECSICMEILHNNTIKLKCKHIFHYSCIQKWGYIKNTCPMCIHKIIYEDFNLQKRLYNNIDKIYDLHNKIKIAIKNIRMLSKITFNNYYLLYQLSKHSDINLTFIETQCLIDCIKKIKYSKLEKMNTFWKYICEELSWKYEPIVF